MEIAFCHLSDLHFQKDSNLNSINIKKKNLINSIKNEITTSSQVVFIVSGDISNTGNRLEYDQAFDFFSDILDQIDSFTNRKSIVIFIPGNHDCDFSNENLNDLVKSIRINIKKNPSEYLIEEICHIFNNFYEFEKTWDDDLEIIDYSQLIKQKAFQIDSYKILFNLVNTAWMSEKKEDPKNIFIPENQFLQLETLDYDLVVSVFHHPYTWLESNAALQFKNYIARISDLVFVGHEHLGEEEIITSRKNSNIYHYGEVLQDTKDSTKSGFTITICNMKKHIYKRTICNWNTKTHAYSLIASDPKELIRNQLSISNKLNYNNAYLKYLTSHDMDIMHPKKDPVTLEDLFIYPDLKVFNYPDKTMVQKSKTVFDFILRKKKLLISGDFLSGKTSC